MEIRTFRGTEEVPGHFRPFVRGVHGRFSVLVGESDEHGFSFPLVADMTEEEARTLLAELKQALGEA